MLKNPPSQARPPVETCHGQERKVREQEDSAVPEELGMPAELREPEREREAGSWVTGTYQLFTSPLLFPGFLLQTLTFLSLLAELRLLWGQNRGPLMGKKVQLPRASCPQPSTSNLPAAAPFAASLVPLGLPVGSPHHPEVRPASSQEQGAWHQRTEPQSSLSPNLACQWEDLTSTRTSLPREWVRGAVCPPLPTSPAEMEG